MAVAVHGDDVTVAASRSDAEWLLACVDARYETKSKHLGAPPNLQKEATLLNRRLY